MEVHIYSQLERITILYIEFLASCRLAGEGKSLVISISDIACP